MRLTLRRQSVQLAALILNLLGARISVAISPTIISTSISGSEGVSRQGLFTNYYHSAKRNEPILLQSIVNNPLLAHAAQNM